VAKSPKVYYVHRILQHCCLNKRYSYPRSSSTKRQGNIPFDSEVRFTKDCRASFFLFEVQPSKGMVFAPALARTFTLTSAEGVATCFAICNLPPGWTWALRNSNPSELMVLDSWMGPRIRPSNGSRKRRNRCQAFYSKSNQPIASARFSTNQIQHFAFRDAPESTRRPPSSSTSNHFARIHGVKHEARTEFLPKRDFTSLWSLHGATSTRRTTYSNVPE
jgi:hypothetical protein